MDGRGDMVYGDLTLLVPAATDGLVEDDETIYRRVLPGDIAVAAPLFISLPSEEDTHTEVDLTSPRVGRVSMSAPNRTPDLSNERDRVSVAFQVVGDYLLEQGRLRSQPPRLLDFFVDHIIKSSSSDNS